MRYEELAEKAIKKAERKFPTDEAKREYYMLGYYDALCELKKEDENNI